MTMTMTEHRRLLADAQRQLRILRGWTSGYGDCAECEDLCSACCTNSERRSVELHRSLLRAQVLAADYHRTMIAVELARREDRRLRSRA